MSKQSLSDFEKNLDNFILKSPTLQRLLKNAEASEEVVTSTLSNPSKFRWKGKRIDLTRIPYEVKIEIPRPLTKNLALQLAILSWYLPDLSRFEIHEDLRKYFLQNFDIYDYQIYLIDKSIMLQALLSETHVSLRTLFGNILTGYYYVTSKDSLTKKSVTYRNNVRIKLKILIPRPAKRKEFKRGYNDRHSSAPDDKKALREEMEIYGSQRILEIENERIWARINLLKLKYKLLTQFGPP